MAQRPQVGAVSTHRTLIEAALAPRDVKVTVKPLGFAVKAQVTSHVFGVGVKRPRAPETGLTALLAPPRRAARTTHAEFLEPRLMQVMNALVYNGDSKLPSKEALLRSFLDNLSLVESGLPHDASLGEKICAWMVNRTMRHEICCNTAATYILELSNYLKLVLPEQTPIGTSVCAIVAKSLRALVLQNEEVNKPPIIPIEVARDAISRTTRLDVRAAIWILAVCGGRWSDIARASSVFYDKEKNVFGVNYNLMKNSRVDSNRHRPLLPVPKDFEPDCCVLKYLHQPLWKEVQKLTVDSINKTLSALCRGAGYTTKSFRYAFHSQLLMMYMDASGAVDYPKLLSVSGHATTKSFKAYLPSVSVQAAALSSPLVPYFHNGQRTNFALSAEDPCLFIPERNPELPPRGDLMEDDKAINDYLAENVSVGLL